MVRLPRWLVCLGLALCALPALAALALEVLTLQQRQADEVLPLIRPFLAPGATATGMNEKLFLRTTPENLAEIRRLLESIDRAPRRLVVSVSQQRDAQATAQGGELAGDIVLGRHGRIVKPPTGTAGGSVEVRRGDSSISARSFDTRSAHSGSATQTVQVVEGGRAWIQVGVSLPVPLRQVFLGPQGFVVSDTVVMRDIGSGFHVEPRLNGDRVVLEISQSADTPGAFGPGSANVQRLATTVSGRLGEWIALGDTRAEADDDGSISLGASSRSVRERRGLWLRVEELR